MGRNDIVRTDGSINYDYLGESIDGLNSQMADIAINVKNFGAKGDGISDDTSAFIAAINSIKYDDYTEYKEAHPILYIPNGVYKLKANQIILGKYFMTIKGQDEHSAILDFSDSNNNGICINTDTVSSNLSIENLKILGNSNLIGLRLYKGSSYINRITLQYFKTGINYILASGIIENSSLSHNLNDINIDSSNTILISKSLFNKYYGQMTIDMTNICILQRDTNIEQNSGVSTFIKIKDCRFNLGGYGYIADLESINNLQIQNVHCTNFNHGEIPLISDNDMLCSIGFCFRKTFINIDYDNVNLEGFRYGFKFEKEQIDSNNYVISNINLHNCVLGDVLNYFYNRDFILNGFTIDGLWAQFNSYSLANNLNNNIFNIDLTKVYGLLTKNILYLGETTTSRFTGKLHYYRDTAIELYVNTSTGNDYIGDGSQPNPFKSISRALLYIDKEQVNDVTIHIMDIGSQQIIKEIPLEAPYLNMDRLLIKDFKKCNLTIVSDAANNNYVIITNDSSRVWTLKNLNNFNNVTLQNLTLQSTNSNGYCLITSSRIILENVILDANSGTSILINNTSAMLNNVTFMNNKNIKLNNGGTLVLQGTTDITGVTFSVKDGIVIKNGAIQSI